MNTTRHRCCVAACPYTSSRPNKIRDHMDKHHNASSGKIPASVSSSNTSTLSIRTRPDKPSNRSGGVQHQTNAADQRSRPAPNAREFQTCSSSSRSHSTLSVPQQLSSRQNTEQQSRDSRPERELSDRDDIHRRVRITGHPVGGDYLKKPAPTLERIPDLASEYPEEYNHLWAACFEHENVFFVFDQKMRHALEKGKLGKARAIYNMWWPLDLSR